MEFFIIVGIPAGVTFELKSKILKLGIFLENNPPCVTGTWVSIVDFAFNFTVPNSLRGYSIFW